MMEREDDGATAADRVKEEFWVSEGMICIHVHR